MPGKRPRDSRPNPLQQLPPTASTESAGEDQELRDERGDEGFLVNLFLNERNQVRLTHIMHVDSNEEDRWDGWDEKKLIDFFVRRVELQLPAIEPETPDHERAGVKTLKDFLDRLEEEISALHSKGMQISLECHPRHGFSAFLSYENGKDEVDVPAVLIEELGSERMEDLIYYVLVKVTVLYENRN